MKLFFLQLVCCAVVCVVTDGRSFRLKIWAVKGEFPRKKKSVFACVRVKTSELQSDFTWKPRQPTNNPLRPGSHKESAPSPLQTRTNGFSFWLRWGGGDDDTLNERTLISEEKKGQIERGREGKVSEDVQPSSLPQIRLHPLRTLHGQTGGGNQTSNQTGKQGKRDTGLQSQEHQEHQGKNCRKTL